MLIVSYEIWSKNFRVTFHNPFQSYHPLPAYSHYCPISTTLWLIQLLALSQTYPAVFLYFLQSYTHFHLLKLYIFPALISDANEVFPNGLPPPFSQLEVSLNNSLIFLALSYSIYYTLICVCLYALLICSIRL